MNRLTQSSLEFSVTSIVWTSDTYEHNLSYNHKLEKYLTEICLFVFDQHLSFKCFPKYSFVGEILTK